MLNKNIEAILFDSGRVLNGPQTGHWFVSPKFFSQVDKNVYESISESKRRKAFIKAGEYINSITVIRTLEEEYSHFRKFYKIFSDELPELQLKEQNIDKLAEDLVYNVEKYKFFEDATEIIPTLYNKYKLAIVSDAWPSLRNVFIHNGLISYFSSFIISSEIGTSKPDERMYMAALEELNIYPDKAIFIDDNINNCLGAKKLGINAVLLCRNRKYYILQKIKSIGKGYKVINSLYELVK